VAALRAMNVTENIELLPLKATITLFGVKIAPILTYSIQLFWDHVKSELQTLEKVKATYLKKLCITWNRVAQSV
jgi:hypothetical protein